MKRKKRLVIDLDETLRPFVKPFLDCYNKKFGSSIQEQDIKTYDMHLYLPEISYSKEMFYKLLIEFAKEIYYDQDPFDQVPETMKILSEEYELLIVTAAPPEVHSYILQWQQDKDMMYSIAFDSDKTKYNGYAIIDDSPFHLANHSCDITICIDREYNKDGVYNSRIEHFHKVPYQLSLLKEFL